MGRTTTRALLALAAAVDAVTAAQDAVRLAGALEWAAAAADGYQACREQLASQLVALEAGLGEVRPVVVVHCRSADLAADLALVGAGRPVPW